MSDRNHSAPASASAITSEHSRFGTAQASAMRALNAGDLRTAELYMIEARAADPYNPMAHFQLGVMLKTLGRVDEAIGSFQVAECLSAGWPEALAHLDSLDAGPLRPTDTSSPQVSAAAQPVASPSPALAAAKPRAPKPRRRPATMPDVPPTTSLWDEEFYRENTPELASGDMGAWQHFLEIGASAGRDPHFLFSTSHYLRANPDVSTSGQNPLLHFLQTGRAEGRSFHWLFSVDAYRALYPDLAEYSDLLDHFLRYGLPENRQPHPLFRPIDYLRAYADVSGTKLPAFEHFLKYGDKEGRTPYPLFNPTYYRSEYKVPTGMGALEHYVRNNVFGNPHPLFHGSFYLKVNPELGPPRLNLLTHYVTTGAPANRAPHPLFDPFHYLTQTTDRDARRNPLLHYVETGASQALSPHPVFDPVFYRNQARKQGWAGAPLPEIGVRISILVPVFNTPPDFLQQCIESVRGQSYASWELCLVDDASTNHKTVEMLERYRGIDARIKVVRSPQNLHIARATNLVAEVATGEFLAFLDHDDTIAVDALAEVAQAVMARPDIDLLYTDEDKIDPSGLHCNAYYKPDWSPDHLMTVMYVLHFLVIRKSLFWSIGGLRHERSGAQDYDLALRASRRARHIHHIPKVLYHWRMIPGSASAEVDAKPYALLAARAAVEDAVAQDGLQATVEDGLLQGTFRVRYSLQAAPPVTLLVFTNNSDRDVPGRGRINMVSHFLRSIAETSTYRKYRIVVVDNQNTPTATKKLIKELGGRIVPFKPEKAFSYARKANFATLHVETEHVIYLNDDLEVISPGWIEALLELLQVPAIGGVGGRLLYPNDRVQHSGVVLGVHGGVGHAFWSLPRTEVGYMGYTHLVRNYSAVSGAVFATRLEVINAIGGFDEKLRVDFNDIDICLRMGAKGWRIAFTPHCELYHFEGSTQIRTTQAPDEIALFHKRWQDKLDFDPYYNPNLPRDRFSFA